MSTATEDERDRAQLACQQMGAHIDELVAGLKKYAIHTEPCFPVCTCGLEALLAKYEIPK